LKRAIALAALALAACLFSPERTAKGGGSDTETLTGIVSGADGTPAARVRVKLIPADYDPGKPDTSLIRHAVTDSSGAFRFERVDTGTAWNLIAGDASRKAWALARGVRPGPGSRPMKLALAKVFLFSLHSPTYNYQDSGIAWFPGTDILAHCNGITETEVDSVPAGALRFIVESRAGWKHDTTLAQVADTAKVQAGKDGIIYTP
jgi:hypothetical protein